MAQNTHSIDWELSSSQYAARADTASLSLTGDHTFEGWVNLESLPSSDIFTILSKWDGGTNTGAYVWDLQHTGAAYQFRHVSNNGSANMTLTQTITAPSTATWYHWAVTFDASASQAEFFIGGVSQGTASGSNTSIQDTDKQFNIGSRDDGVGGGGETDFFDGKMNNVRIWSDIRTSGELAANMNKVLTNTGTDNLVDVWYYNDNHASASGNNDLTAVNTPVFSTDVPFTTISETNYFYFM